MEKKRMETMIDNYRQAERRREILYQILDRLENCELDKETYRQAENTAWEQIGLLKQEREQMLVYVAEETRFVDEAETRLREIERVNRKHHLFPPAPTNAQIDHAEKKNRHFAQGMSYYKLFWVFFIGCFAGVMIEQIWCLIRTGTFEPRVGLIYGPFNLVYGIGAFALTLTLYPFRNRTKLLSLLGGMIIGSVVEYGCSLFQEVFFGSVSWDYSDRAFNLHGRICLQYSVYWGILGVLWIKDLYPRMAKWILRIPNKCGKALTVALTVFMIFNSVMTGLGMARWIGRREGTASSGRLDAYFDTYFPDDKMQKMFSNLEFVEK